jgi:DNA-directed RNA polymerase subunit E'/Rpb7
MSKETAATKSLSSLFRSTKNDNQSNVKTSKQKTSKPSKHSKMKEIKESTESETIDSTDMAQAIKLNEIIYPCKDEILYTRVILHPHQMNNDIYINLKKNLIDKIENRCIKDGFIVKVHKIIEYTNGIIEPENFTGSAVYDVQYFAKICVALKESIIVTKVTTYIPSASLVLTEFGPIIKIISTKNKRDLNTRNFAIGNDKSILHIASQRKIGSGDWVKIQLKSIKFRQNDTVIKCMGYLDDIASPDEIEKYAYKNDYDSNAVKESNIKGTIYFNEDNEQEENNIEQSLSNKPIDIIEPNKTRNKKMDI